MGSQPRGVCDHIQRDNSHKDKNWLVSFSPFSHGRGGRGCFMVLNTQNASGSSRGEQLKPKPNKISKFCLYLLQRCHRYHLMLFPPVANEDVNKRLLSGHVGLSWNSAEFGAKFTFTRDELEISCGTLLITVHVLVVLRLGNATKHSSTPAVTKTNIPLTPLAESIILKKIYFSFFGLRDNCLTIKIMKSSVCCFPAFNIPCLHLQAFWRVFF